MYWSSGSTSDVVVSAAEAVRPRFASKLAWEPRVDILERRSEILVMIELAGVLPEDFSIQLLPETNELLIKGVRRLPDMGKFTAHQLEVYYGEFNRQVSLPSGTYDERSLRAELLEGIVTVVLQKAS